MVLFAFLVVFSTVLFSHLAADPGHLSLGAKFSVRMNGGFRVARAAEPLVEADA